MSMPSGDPSLHGVRRSSATLPADSYPAGVMRNGVELASWIQRVRAALIDWAIPCGLLFAAIAAESWLTLGAAVGFLLWNLVRQGRTGQTVGKRMFDLALVRERTGEFVGPGLSILRYVLHAADQALWGLGYFWPLWDKKRQTFADKIVGTVVIVLPPEPPEPPEPRS